MNAWYSRTIAAAALLAAGLAPVPGHAMTDPTQPPASVAAGTEGTAGHGRTPVLQSVMILPQRRFAIIDGARVEVGGRVGEADVVSITETEVTLRLRGRVEVLKMYPDVEKKLLQGAAAASPKPPAPRSRP